MSRTIEGSNPSEEGSLDRDLGNDATGADPTAVAVGWLTGIANEQRALWILIINLRGIS